MGLDGARDEISHEGKYSTQTLKFAIKGTTDACENWAWKHEIAQSRANNQIARESRTLKEF